MFAAAGKNIKIHHPCPAAGDNDFCPLEYLLFGVYHHVES
jgi:hypothetical protein